jgi:hypothetical protein
MSLLRTYLARYAAKATARSPMTMGTKIKLFVFTIENALLKAKKVDQAGQR